MDNILQHSGGMWIQTINPVMKKLVVQETRAPAIADHLASARGIYLGNRSSNPLPSSGESPANLTSAI